MNQVVIKTHHSLNGIHGFIKCDGALRTTSRSILRIATFGPFNLNYATNLGKAGDQMSLWIIVFLFDYFFYCWRDIPNEDGSF